MRWRKNRRATGAATMITDPIFYRLFETSPEIFFLLLGMSPELAADTAARYEYKALEFKETSFRVDGVFLPKEAALPVYFLEVQFYRLPSVYANLMAKVYTYLKQHDPAQAYCGVVLFADRSLEPSVLTHYQPLLDAGLIRRFYLEEMPELANAPLGLSMLYLIRQTESEAPATARNLVARAKTEIADESLRANLIKLIETVIMYKMPRLSRKEIQAMLQIHDIRESLAYQETLKEGIEKGIEKGIAIAKLAAAKKSVVEIAAALQLDVELVRQMLEQVDRN
jgi:predicted transposase/invertase (TIGR01784 family)